MKTTKRSLLASGLAVLVCIAMLAGTTFAWFTDSVVNKGNKIQSGSLSIDAYAYDLDKDGTGGFTIGGVNGGKPFTFEEEGQDLKEDSSPILNETLWEPGKSSAKLLKVQNNGTLAAKIKLDFTVIDGGLQDALWFDFVQVKDGQVTGQFTKRPMSELATIAQNLELPVLAGQNVQFILVYGMNEEAGNEYQDMSFSADIMIQATQYTEEEDGFGSDQYDKDATYATPVSTGEQFVGMADQGGEIKLTDNVNIENASEVVFSKDTTIDMNGYTLDINGSIKSAVGTTLTVKGNGVLNGALYADRKFNNGSNLVIEAGDDFTVNSPGDYAVYGGLGSSVTIHGGTYINSKKGNSVIQMLGNSLEIKDATINVAVDTVLNGAGISSNASENYLENVTVNGKYSIAVDFVNEYGKAVIQGGSFITDKKVDDGGFKPNPTIRYKGSLDISGADITRIGHGILYSRSYPVPTEAENLTCTGCTFHVVEGSVGYNDIDYRK